MTTAEQTIITAHEVARRLHVSHSTVLREVRAGTLPCLGRVGRNWAFDPAQIERVRRDRLADRRAEVEGMAGDGRPGPNGGKPAPPINDRPHPKPPTKPVGPKPKGK